MLLNDNVTFNPVTYYDVTHDNVRSDTYVTTI